jgi:hypothetical protein
MKLKGLARVFFGFVLVLGLCDARDLGAQVGQLQDRSSLAPETFLTPEQVSEDLDQFQRELEGRFAYLKTNDADYLSALRSIRRRAASGMTVHNLGIELKRVMGLFIDCHARISGYGAPEGYLPFHIEQIGNRYVAFQADRTGFLEASHPYIVAIDGRSIEEWGSILDVVLPEGSPTFLRTFTLLYLSYIQFARQIAGQLETTIVDVELESKDGRTRLSLALPVAGERPTSMDWPDTQSHIMEGNIGYLRITAWDEEAFNEVALWMPQFASTRGLIIDIRHNPGGTRNVLRELYPYFVSEERAPHVAGAAKYRLYRDFGPDHLSSRNLYPLSWTGWTAAERTAIAEFMETFRPEWHVPETEFSDWHFWVLSKASNPRAYSYEGRPIVFLMDHWNLSASDVILSSVKGLPNITLLGSPSGGMSGAIVDSILEHSELGLRLSSMASFQNTGRLFDGVGVEPDIHLDPEPEYYLVNGPDIVLERAVQIVMDRNPSQN